MAVRLSEEYTRAIWDLTEALQGEKQIESALTHGMEIMKETIGCEAGFVWLRSSDGDTLTVIACACGQDMTGVTVGRTQGVVGHVDDYQCYQRYQCQQRYGCHQRVGELICVFCHVFLFSGYKGNDFF